MTHEGLPFNSPPTQPSTRSRLGGRQWRIGLLVLGLGLLLQFLPHLLLQRWEGLLARFVFWVLEMPLLILVLTLGYNWAQHRQLRPLFTVSLSLLVSLLLGALSSFLAWHLVLSLWGPTALPGPPGRTLSLALRIAFGATSGVFSCGLWAFAFIFPLTVEDARLRAAETDKLRLEAETLRTRSELSRLRSQLEPHFLLNTLNAIAGLVTQEPKQARKLLATLGALLSETLKEENEEQRLGEEMAWLRDYASILETRFASSLRFEWDEDPHLRALPIPHLLLQPVVENAVTHGALRRAQGGGLVRIRVQLRDEGEPGSPLICEIEDNGPGFDPRQEPRKNAIGLKAVQKRLELWSPEARLAISSSDEGTTVRIELPQKRSGS